MNWLWTTLTGRIVGSLALAALAGALWFALWEHPSLIADLKADAVREGVRQADEASRKVIDQLRLEKLERDERIRDREAELASLRAVLNAKDRAETETAVREAADAAPKNPACAPSPDAIRLWNDAVDRLNRAAKGSSQPRLQPRGRPHGRRGADRGTSEGRRERGPEGRGAGLGPGTVGLGATARRRSAQILARELSEARD